MDDIQSWWEVPSIAHFCSLFRVAFNLLDFDIEELEEALLTDGTELNGSSLLQDLIVRLLCGCLGHNGISTFNYQMFLRRLFRSKCKEQGRENPFNTDIDFQFLPLRTKVEILHALCDFRLDADDVIDVLKNLDSDSLRVHPLGHDESRAAYWYFYGTRLYKEEYPKKRKRKKDHDKFKSKKKKKSETSSEEECDELGSSGTWKVLCYTEEDWRNLADSLEGSTSKEERALHAVLSEDFLPEIPRLFEEKERLQKKRLQETQPRRQSQRLEKLKSMKTENAEQLSTTSGETKEKDRYGERERISREKMRRRERRAAARSLRRSRSNSSEISSGEGSYMVGPPLVGRQTNNSLASATGEIIIKPTRQKFRNSQLFRRTREDLMTGMYKILDRVKAHDDAWPFLDPVDEAYAPKYYAVIAKPMDLQTMEDKLDNGEYGSLQQFKADFQLIVDNCRQYNGSGNEYTEMVRRLQELFEASSKRYLEIDPSSEDEPPLRPPYLSDEDTLGSSLTPVNEPRSRSISSISHSSGSGQDIHSIFNPSFSNQAKHSVREHKSRLRKRQKRKKRNIKEDYSTAEENDGDIVRSKTSVNQTFDRRARSLTDSSNDRSKINKKYMKNEKRSISREMTDERGGKESSKHRDSSREKNKSREMPVSSETSSERTKPKVNYKEEGSSESEVLSDSTDDSHYNSKYKQKTPPKKPVKRAGIIKNSEALAALELATEQTLKDISRWLDDTPKFSEFSSNSNSPLHVPYTEEMASIEGEYRRRLQLDRPVRPRDRLANDLHRRRMFKEQLGLKRRKEVQRTIDRLQPGKSKGNLLSKEHQDNSAIESKFSTSDNDDNTPKISLGKVLASGVLGFGIGDTCKKDSEDECTEDKLVIEEDDSKEDKANMDESNKDSLLVKEEKPIIDVPEPKKEKPTPNLSAWFKAFGAPKAQINVKKKTDPEEVRMVDNAKSIREDEMNMEEERKITCTIDLPARRQRKASTGSSISERSSFSQEPIDGNSPRPSIDEPYLSPQQEPKLYHHSPINGTIKVGFYQDTCFPRGSSEKSSSPRDLPSCSPRDLPSVSPRTPYCSPRTPYSSPRNAPISPRDYPNENPRSPYCSPRNRPVSPRDYPSSSPLDITNSSPHHFSAPSPQEMATNLMRRDYLNDNQKEMITSPKENHQVKDDYQTFSPVPHCPNTSLYSGLTPHYPSHLGYIDNSKSITEHYRNVEKTPLPVYPVKKRAYNEMENVQGAKSPTDQMSAYKGASFTPTRGAMEQERTFTPTPGRIPGPSQPLRVSDPTIPLGLTHPLQHHLMDPYGEERHLSSPYYPGENVYSKGQTASSSHPIFSQPSVLTSTYTRDGNIPHNYDRHQNESSVDNRIMPPLYESRSPVNTYNTTSQPETYKAKAPLLNFTGRNTPPRMNTSPNSALPINYSNPNNEMLIKGSASTSKVSEPQRIEDMPTTSSSFGKVDTPVELSSHGKINAPPSLAYTNSRLSEMLPPKVNTSYNRTMPPELSQGINNYNHGQDLGKLGVPIPFNNQPDLLSAKMNYNHPMADLMQSSARYNYQMTELMQGKGAVYNHPMQEYMQGKPSTYSNIMQPNLATYNRPISEIMQRKVGDMQPNEMVYQTRTSLPPVNKTELAPKPKKGRKKKTDTSPSGFQQYVAPTSEPLSLKTSGVPGSAFNFGPPLKDGYTYLDEIRSPYYVSRSETNPTKSGGTSHSPSYFLGHTSTRPSYPHALYNAQYQEYLQCASRHSEDLLRPMVIHQGLLPPAAGYPPGYLGMHSAINRPSWL